MPEQNLKQTDETAPELEVASSSSAPAPAKKVELDLDDAPFLQAEEQEPPQDALDKDLPAAGEDEEALARKRKKRRIIIASACAALLLLIFALWWFVFRTPPPPPPEAPKPDVVVVPSTPATTEPQEFVREFAPFVVPVGGNADKTNFLICKFSAITKDAKVNEEMSQRMIPLRDAIYFYLRGKDSNYLLDARNGAGIKKDLLSVFNDYLTQGKLEDIVFESYLSH